jgi:hypothetical protein
LSEFPKWERQVEGAERRQEFRTPQRGRWAWANEDRQVMPGKKNPKKERERNSVRVKTEKRGCLSAFSAGRGHGSRLFLPALLCSANFTYMVGGSV